MGKQTVTTTTIESGVPLRDRLVLTMPEAAALSGIPLRNLKAAVRAGELAACYAGSSRKCVRRADLDRFVESLPEADD